MSLAWAKFVERLVYRSLHLTELWTLTEYGDSTGWQAVNLRQMEQRRSDSEAPLYNYWSSHCPCPIPVPYLSRTPDLRMPLSWNLMCWYSRLPLRGNTSPWHWKHAAILVCTGSTSSSVQTLNLTPQVILCWLHDIYVKYALECEQILQTIREKSRYVCESWLCWRGWMDACWC